jgi:hypothetical protein
MEMPIIPTGIKPSTFRLAAQWLNQLPATFVAHKINIVSLLLHHLMFECMRVYLMLGESIKVYLLQMLHFLACRFSGFNCTKFLTHNPYIYRGFRSSGVRRRVTLGPKIQRHGVIFRTKINFGYTTAKT